MGSGHQCVEVDAEGLWGKGGGAVEWEMGGGGMGGSDGIC